MNADGYPDILIVADDFGLTTGRIGTVYVYSGKDGKLLTSKSGARLFVKTNTRTKLSMFEAEAEALAALKGASPIRIPEVLGVGTCEDDAFLALEHIPMSTPGPDSWQALGEGLAELHRNISEQGAFGWHRDNVIGETPQPNIREPDWGIFFKERRLRHQFSLAENNGFRFERSDQFGPCANKLKLETGLLWIIAVRT